MLRGLRSLASAFLSRVHLSLLIQFNIRRCGWIESGDHMQSVIELRRAKRYQLSVLALFTWAPQEGKPRNGKGVTRDINALGVYVQADSLPPAGARVQMEIVLPKLADSSPGMHLQGEGIVLRCESGDATKRGFAASALFYPEATEAVLSQLKASGQIA